MLTLVGSTRRYCTFSNLGGLVHPTTPIADQDELSSLLQVPIVVRQGTPLAHIAPCDDLTTRLTCRRAP